LAARVRVFYYGECLLLWYLTRALKSGLLSPGQRVDVQLEIARAKNRMEQLWRAWRTLLDLRETLLREKAQPSSLAGVSRRIPNGHPARGQSLNGANGLALPPEVYFG
jgi:hypothetical protein